MIYNFKEATLSDQFCKKFYGKVAKLINQNSVFTILGVPGVGVSYFLRYFASKETEHFNADVCFIFVDTYSLASLSKNEYMLLLLKELGGESEPLSTDEIFKKCEEQLTKLVSQYKKVVIIFNRFDQLRKEFDKHFVSQMRNLRYIDTNKISMIFTSNKPLYEVAPEAISGNNIHFFSQNLCFNIYSKSDLLELVKLNHNNLKLPKETINKIIDIAGGHNQLLNILLNSESLQNPLQDRFVKLQMQEIYEYLNYHQRKTLEKIALGKSLSEVDPYLINMGIVKESGGKFRLFTPLLEEYIRQNATIKIPAKEGKLYRLLKSKLGQVVSKDQIFEIIWKDNPDQASDWALNALIYRLRKNPAFKLEHYEIESYKKIGYSLVKT